MAVAILYKGSDEVIQLTITDEVTDLPVDLALCDDIIVSAYQTKENIIQQWLLSESEVTITDASNGICQVNLDRDNTAKIPSKRVYGEVVLQYVDADFEDGVRLVKNIPTLVLFDLKDSVT